MHSRLGGSIRLAYIQVAINAAFYAWIKLLQNAFCKIFQSVLAIDRSNHLEVATATIPGRIMCEVRDTVLYDFGWFLWEPGFSIGHITAVFNIGAISPLSRECLQSIYRGSLSSSAHSFKRVAGKRSVPAAALFFIFPIASEIHF